VQPGDLGPGTEADFVHSPTGTNIMETFGDANAPARRLPNEMDATPVARRRDLTHPLRTNTSQSAHRPSSQDALLLYGSNVTSPMDRQSTPARLILHSRSELVGDDEGKEDIPELKREILGLDDAEGVQSGPSGRSTSASTSAGRRRRQPETEYVVHRDAGRVSERAEEPEERRRVELPPRYNDVNWQEGQPEEI